MAVIVGIDIGQKRDHTTAICVVENERRRSGDHKDVHFLVRHLERLPLGTPYPQVADRVSEIAQAVSQRGGSLQVYVDATGLGQPLIDLLDSRSLPGTLSAVYFTYGDRRTKIGPGEVRLGKAYLVARLQMLLQSNRLHLPRSADAEALAEDLLNYEIQVDENANDRYGAFKVGRHDDLVTALGLAVQTDEFFEVTTSVLRLLY